MLKIPNKNSLFTVLFLLFLVLLFAVSLAPASWQISQPQVNQGIMDLRQWNFSEQGSVNLNGEWELYWKNLLTPSQVKDFAESRIYHHLPDFWAGQRLENIQLTRDGYATYRAVINLPPQHATEMALRIPVIFTAYKLWVDDNLVASRGIVGTSYSQTKPLGLPQLAFFTVDNNQVEVVLQVSNYHDDLGGIWSEIYFGSSEQIMALHDRNVQIQMFLLGCLVIMAIYYLGLFTFHRNNKSYLFFAILCLLCTSRVIFAGEVLMLKWFPGLEWELAKKLEYVAFHLILPCFSIFTAKLYPQETSRKINSLILGVSLVYVVIDLFTPTRFFTALTISYQIIIFISAIYLYWVIIKARINHTLESSFSLVGGLILLLTVINDLLFYNGMYNLGADLVSIGLVFFIFSQSVTLSIRLSYAFNHNERLTNENTSMIAKIMTLNQTLEERIKARTVELNDTIAKLNMEIAERKEAEKKLTLYATTDIMTGLSNRATGMLILEKQLHQASRDKYPLTICFLDIDGLKLANDTFGHQVGDELIINTSRILAESIRKSDTVSRLGGDEFLIIMPNCTKAEARTLWQRVITRLDEFSLLNTTPYKLKASYGFAEYNPHEPLSVRELLEQADNRMYAMKRS